jgi:RNA polymerase sigma factor (sigma-70 family)
VLPWIPEERMADSSPPQNKESNETLLRLCAEGDEAAWKRLVLRYQNLVYSTALEVGLGEEDAGDVFQDVWLELHRSIPRIRNAEALPRWFIVATRRLSYKVAVRRRRMLPDISADMVDPAALPDTVVEDAESRLRLEDALTQLGGKCEKLLRLLFLHARKLPYDEISRRTGLAIGSIGPIRSRCLARMRKILEGTS